MTVRIANAAGFWGDNLDAPRITVANSRESGKSLDYLTLEYLAELTMSILARQRQKDPNAGYATDFITVLGDLIPELKQHNSTPLKIVTNAGGMNPTACAKAAAKLLNEATLDDTKIGIVSGDDLLPRIPELQKAGCEFRNLDTDEPLSSLKNKIVAANAYLGAEPIADCLQQGAGIVITGRVADASLTLGPALHEFGWKMDDWPMLSAASVAGHIIECGALATGGAYPLWQNLNLAEVGYPIAELEADGSCVITKPANTGGAVTTATVSEQIVYEIGDPRAYLTPDVTVDFTTVSLKQVGENRVQVLGPSGTAPTESYKVSLAYENGYTANGQVLVYGPDCVEKAKACAEMIRKRVERAGHTFEKFHVECLGAGDGVPGLHSAPRELREVVLRVSVQSSSRAACERFSREFAPLVTSGPPGLAGYASFKSDVRPMFAYWPTLVPKSLVTPKVEVKSARELS